MGVNAVELNAVQLEKIGSYVKSHLGEWIREKGIYQTDPQLLERMVRVEEELKSQRELMIQGFQQADKRMEIMETHMEQSFSDMDKRLVQMDKRIEQVDKRFEQVDKRFESQERRMDSFDRRFNSIQWTIGIGVSIILGLMSYFQFAA